MNCIDHHLATNQFCFRTVLIRSCLLAAAFALFASLFAARSTPALAGPQFSIPGLQSLQRKFQKRRRHKNDRQQENAEDEPFAWREDTLPSSPPPLPQRNPRFVETERFLGSLTLQEPEGLKQALKAQQVLRTKTKRRNRREPPTEKASANNLKRATKTARSRIAPTRWSRPQSKLPGRMREELPPAHDESAPNLTADRLDEDQLAIALPIAPPLPVRKPRRHPSQIVEEDWSAAVIENATLQCATLGIEIKPMPPVKKGLCGNPAPILLPVIGAATVRPAATISCPMAANLSRWFSQSVQPLALKHFGKKVQQIRNVSSYVCRNRYGDTNTRISEHAYANALDIAHFELQGGEKISVLKDWTTVEGETEPNPKSAFLHAVHKSACEHFGTVLGPDANDAHKDHFHLDKAPRKRSNYCR